MAQGMAQKPAEEQPSTQKTKLKCPKCGAEVPKKSKFCNDCGNKMTATCPKCGTEVKQNVKFCNECGTQL